MADTHSIDKVIVNAMIAQQAGGRFATKQKIFFFKELSYLLKGGVSIVDAISTMGHTSGNAAIRSICTTISAMLNEGKSLTYAMSRLPKAFPESDVAIIKSGEQSGQLTTVLAALANEYQFLGQIKGMYIGAMIYPLILITVSVGAVFALFIFILPGIFELVAQFDMESLPPTTIFLMNTSQFLNENFMQLGVGGVVAIILFIIVLSTEGGKRAFYGMIFEIPMFNKITKYYQLIKFCRYMKLMLAAGLSYIDIFKLEKEILTMPAYQDMIEDVIVGLDRGESIFEQIQYHTNIIPADVLVLLKVGEETATLKESLQNIVEMYEEELRNLINNIGKVIEPILIVGVGGIIAVIALSVFGLIGNILDALPAL